MHACMVLCPADVAGALPCVRPQPRPGAHLYSASSRMRLERVPPVAWQRDVPESIRSLGGLANPDYLDLFTATTTKASEKPAEDWARPPRERIDSGTSR